jgi:hypothetical protein
MRNQVLVFKTSVTSFEEVETLHPALEMLTDRKQWNFDLEDCDRILRVESPHVCPEKVIGLLSEMGFSCEELAD